MRSSFVHFLIATTLLFVCAMATAKEVGGVVMSLRGDTLERQKTGTWSALAQGDQVSMGERLRTDKTTVAVINFPTVGRFVIGPGSDIELGQDPKNFTTKMNRGASWMRQNGSRLLPWPPALIYPMCATS